MSKDLYVPAISREVEFIVKHVSIADAIYNEDLRVSVPIEQLTQAVYDRADVHMESLLFALEEAVSQAVKGIVRIKWANTNRGDYWRIYGTVYKVHGKKKLGSAGVFFPRYYGKPLHLIGWSQPLGGLDGRKTIARACLGKLDNVKVVSEHPKEYSEWPHNDDVVIWFDQKLTPATPRDELCSELCLRAKRFFKIVKQVS